MNAMRVFVTSAILAVGPALADVAPTELDIRPLLIGSVVPDATVRALDGSSVSVHDVIDGRPTVLVFYRGGWCPFCSRQLAELRHTVAPLRELGVQMVGISGDTVERLQPFLEGDDQDLTLVSDYELDAAEAFGLAFHVSDAYVDKLAEYDLDTSGNSVSSEQVLPVPAVFLVDGDNVITFSYVNPNYRVRCDPDVILAAARAMVKES